MIKSKLYFQYPVYNFPVIHFPYSSYSLESLTSFSDSVVFFFFSSLPVSNLIPKFLVHFLVVGSRETKVKCESRSVKSKLFYCASDIR